MAIVAAEDWSMSVMMAPVTMNIRIEPMPKPVRCDRKTRTGSLSRSIVEVSRKVLRPRNRKAKPITNSPKFLLFFFLEAMRR